MWGQLPRSNGLADRHPYRLWGWKPEQCQEAGAALTFQGHLKAFLPLVPALDVAWGCPEKGLESTAPTPLLIYLQGRATSPGRKTN